MIENRLKHLQEEHDNLDKKIHGMESTGIFDDEHLHELKKLKLFLKDKVEKIKREHNL